MKSVSKHRHLKLEVRQDAVISLSHRTHRGPCAPISVPVRCSHSRIWTRKAVSKSSIVLIEGYLWDSLGAVELIGETVHVAKRAQTKVALTLSDPMLVERHRNPMYDFVRQHVDILFANELEAQQLCQTDGWEDAQKAISASVNQTVITRGR